MGDLQAGHRSCALSGVNLWKWLGGARLTDLANLPTPIFSPRISATLFWKCKKIKKWKKKEKIGISRRTTGQLNGWSLISNLIPKVLLVPTVYMSGGGFLWEQLSGEVENEFATVKIHIGTHFLAPFHWKGYHSVFTTSTVEIITF